MKFHKKRTPKVPDCTFINLLHRGHGAGVTFHRKSPPKEFENVGLLPAMVLKDRFPALAEELQGDCYFSINGFHCKAGNQRGGLTGFKGARKTHNVRFLNALFTDLDRGDEDMSIPDMERGLRQRVDDGALPEPSMLFYSGRGMWAIWLLGTPEYSIQATPHAIDLFNAGQVAIYNILAPLGADANAKDICRIMRVPGTRNSTSGTLTAYRLIDDVRHYELPDILTVLRKALGKMALPFHTPPKKQATNAAKWDASLLDVVPRAPWGPSFTRGRKGKESLLSGRLRQLQILHDTRGGFREGHRNNALVLYCAFAHALNRGHSQIRDIARMISRKAIPPLSEAELDAAFAWGEKKPKFRDETISDWLHITPEEEELLAVECVGVRSTWKRAAIFYPNGKRPLPPLKGKAKVAARREALKAFIEMKGGEVPPLRTIEAYMREQGHVSSANTIRNDMKALDIENPRARK